ncbi:MAG: hypothetical protein H0U57_00555 [Tatlockia sp.]|nr:hypothetical protein [Tatlockia sp.]
MRKIQTERKLFELLGFKFFVFENFKDTDLNIDDKSIYKFEDKDKLVDIFASKKFFDIWSDNRRLNSNLICACEGNLNLVVAFLHQLGIKEEAYSTSNCGKLGEPSVLYLSKESMYAFIQSLGSALTSKKFLSTAFFSSQGSINAP